MKKSHQITLRLNDQEYKQLMENMKLQKEQCEKNGIRIDWNITESISKAIFTENHYLRGNLIWKY